MPLYIGREIKLIAPDASYRQHVITDSALPA